MKKAVTLFYLLAVFSVISCSTVTESELEILTLADRAGVYTKEEGSGSTAKTIVLMLNEDGTGKYINVSTSDLIVGSYESTDTNFFALKKVANSNPVFAAEITFYLDNPNKVKYNSAGNDATVTLTKIEL